MRAATGGSKDWELAGASDDGTPKDLSNGLGSSKKRLLLCAEK